MIFMSMSTEKKILKDGSKKENSFMKEENKKEEVESPEMTAALIFQLLENIKFLIML